EGQDDDVLQPSPEAGRLGRPAGSRPIARLEFDLAAIGLPEIEKTRTVSNLFVVLVSGIGKSSVKAKLVAAKPGKTIVVTVADSVAFSNSPPITDPLVHRAALAAQRADRGRRH